MACAFSGVPLGCQQCAAADVRTLCACVRACVRVCIIAGQAGPSTLRMPPGIQPSGRSHQRTKNVGQRMQGYSSAWSSRCWMCLGTSRNRARRAGCTTSLTSTGCSCVGQVSLASSSSRRKPRGGGRRTCKRGTSMRFFLHAKRVSARRVMLDCTRAGLHYASTQASPPHLLLDIPRPEKC
jgi:hypothetical protein